MMFAADAAVQALLTSGDGKVAVGNIVEVQALPSFDFEELKDREGSDTEDGPCVLRWGLALSC